MNQYLCNIPVGFRFEPSDEELISAFLVPKVRGEALPWYGIVEKVLYGDGAAPWEVFSDMDDICPSFYCTAKREGNTTKTTVYVFNKVTKAAPNAKKRVCRLAGCGTWSGQTGPKYITDSTTGEVIGFTKMLSFKHKGDDKPFGHWIMHEYSLTPEWSSDFVLCRITRCVKDDDPDCRPLISSPEIQPDCKKQKRDLVGSGALTPEERTMMNSEPGPGKLQEMMKRSEDDQVTANGLSCRLDNDIEKSNVGFASPTSNHDEEYAEVLDEMLIRTKQSAAAAPPPSTTTGCSTLSGDFDDDIGQVFSHLDSVPPPDFFDFSF